MQGTGYAAADLDVGTAVRQDLGQVLWTKPRSLLDKALPLKKLPEITMCSQVVSVAAVVVVPHSDRSQSARVERRHGTAAGSGCWRKARGRSDL